MLQAHGVSLVADVRTVPRSRHNPQFNRESLPLALKAVSIGYVHLAGLGGWRSPRADSPNRGWRNPAFQGYADYLLTPEFEAHLEALIELARRQRVALMCAEALPWRCHRSLIADALLVRGISVEHIMSLGEFPAPPAHALGPGGGHGASPTRPRRGQWRSRLRKVLERIVFGGTGVSPVL